MVLIAVLTKSASPLALPEMFTAARRGFSVTFMNDELAEHFGSTRPLGALL